MYATFAFPLFLAGFSVLVMSALAGRASAFRFFFGTATWNSISSASIGLYYCAPMVALFYFMTTQHQVHVTYYMFVYYFCGNFMFGAMVYIPVCMFVDKPLQAMLNLKQDIKDANRSQYYKIHEYMDNFREEQLDEPLIDPVAAQIRLQSDQPEIVDTEPSQRENSLFQGLAKGKDPRPTELDDRGTAATDRRASKDRDTTAVQANRDVTLLSLLFWRL